MREIEQRKRAQHMRAVDRRGGAQHGAVELGIVCGAEQAEAHADFGLEQLQQPPPPRLARRRQGVAIKPADADGVGAQRQRLDDVAAAAEAAIDDDRTAGLHRRRPAPPTSGKTWMWPRPWSSWRPP